MLAPDMWIWRRLRCLLQITGDPEGSDYCGTGLKETERRREREREGKERERWKEEKERERERRRQKKSLLTLFIHRNKECLTPTWVDHKCLLELPCLAAIEAWMCGLLTRNNHQMLLYLLHYYSLNSDVFSITFHDECRRISFSFVYLYFV